MSLPVIAILTQRPCRNSLFGHTSYTSLAGRKCVLVAAQEFAILYSEVSLCAKYMVHKVVEQGVLVLARPGALALRVKLA